MRLILSDAEFQVIELRNVLEKLEPVLAPLVVPDPVVPDVVILGP